MADWAFNIVVGDWTLTESGRKQYVIELRSYKRPHWVTAALPKIVKGFEAYIQVKVNGRQVAMIEAKRWLKPEIGDPSDWDRYFSEMMEDQRYYEREKARMREDERAKNVIT